MYSNFIFAFLTMCSMSIFTPSENLSKNPKDTISLGLEIQQGEKRIPIRSSEQHIFLSKDRFTVFFNLKRDDDVAEKFYAGRLITDVDDGIFNQFEVDKTFEEIPSLMAGTSMAGPQDRPYDCIFFDDQAHHYIFYANEEENRAHLVSEENDLLKLSFDVENYCMQDLEVNIKNSNFEQIFMVFFIDENLNQVVDDGEFVKLEVSFKNE